MPLTTEEYAVIKEIVKDAIEEKQTEFWVEAEQHYLDHKQLRECRASKEDWQKNHEWMSGIRESADTVKKVTLRVAVGTLVTAAIAWLLYSAGLTPGQ